MHAFLVLGGSMENRNSIIADKLTEWQVTQFDQIIIGSEALTLGIREVREFIRKITLAPQYGEFSVGIIRNAYLLTVEAQQALLKTLEEPPPHAKIIIESHFVGKLLSTVISRCTVITSHAVSVTEPENVRKNLEFISLVRSESPGNRCRLLGDAAKNREDAVVFVTELLHSLHVFLTATPGTEPPGKTYIPRADAARLVPRLINALKQLEVNVTTPLVLDHIFL